MRRPSRLAAVAAAVVVLGGLLVVGVLWWTAVHDGLDVRRAERAIARDYERQVDGARVDRVRCPDEVDDDPGTEARCTMRLSDGTSGTVRVRVRDDGRLRWDVETPDR